MKRQKRSWLSLLLSLLLLFFGSGCAEAAYTVTDQQLTQLETVFSQLKEQQLRQEEILNQQKNQIEMLRNQLAESQTAMENSRKQLQVSENSLAEANQSLQKSAEEAKRTQKRLERQRDIWATIAAITVGAAIARG